MQSVYELPERDSHRRELSQLGWLYFISILLHVLAAVSVGLLTQKGITVSVESTLIIAEISILFPSLVFMLVKKLGFRSDLGFRPIKPGTFFMCILLTVLITPAAQFVNVLSQLFVDNAMIEMSDSLFGGSDAAVIILGSVFGPLCEEIVFRGIFNNRYSLFTGPMRAALISALFFGLAHLNINQAGYAFVLGFAFSVVNNAAGSIFPSLIIHICINGTNLLMMFGLTAANRAMGIDSELATRTASTEGRNMLYVLIGITLFWAIVCTALAVPCIIWISKHENNREKLYDMFYNSHPKVRWLTFSCIAAILFVLFIMFGLNPLLSVIKNGV